MRKAEIVLFLLLLCLPLLLYAQDEDDSDDGPSIDSEWDYYDELELYSAGDKTFTISLGLMFPTVFFNNGKVIEHNLEPPVGGTGSLAYNFFLNSHFFLGLEIQGMFISTLRNNTLFIIPIGARAGYQFVLYRFEFPLSVTLGMTWHKYLDLGYYGFYMKGGVAVYFRFNSDWSFGLNANWCWFPESTQNRNENVDGNMVDATLSVRYHF